SGQLRQPRLRARWASWPRVKHSFMPESSTSCFRLIEGGGRIQAMLDSQPLTAEERAGRIAEAIRVCTKTRTKAQVAELLGVTPQAITGWEKTGRINRESLAGLALLSGHPIEYFIDRRPQKAEEWVDVQGYAQAVGLGKGAEAQEYAETHKLKFRAESLARKR